MFDFDPFDMDFDGDVDPFDFLGFDHLLRQVLWCDEGACQEELDEHDPQNHRTFREFRGPGFGVDGYAQGVGSMAFERVQEDAPGT